MWNRRTFLEAGALAASGILLPRTRGAQAAGLPEGALATEERLALPGKRALIKKTFRPPNYETPLELLGGEFTPNDAFFVRYHLATIPEVAAEGYQVSLTGEGLAQPGVVTLQQLKKEYEAVEIAAVCQCAGNRRGLFDPHVAGVQWGHGAIGNARWRGVRLRDVLTRAGIGPGVVEVAFSGADGPVLEGTPDYEKSLPIDKAMDPDTLLCFRMNGAELPRANGYPLRLVVPGWAATYWMKHVTAVRALKAPLQSFWMKTGYRIPLGKFKGKERFESQRTETNVPITEMVVNSLVTSHAEGARVRSGQPVELRGVAWDGGAGVQSVEVAVDGQWRPARLGRDHGRYSWRTFAHRFTPQKAGECVVQCRARSQRGEEQPETVVANPAGYHHNAVQRLLLIVAAWVMVLLPGVGQADEARLRLKDGPDRELVQARCSVCHSVDYIQMNSPFLEAKGWESEVNKMVKVYQAPVTPPEQATILTYLVRYYGKPTK